jgi:hypothetical protein
MKFNFMINTGSSLAVVETITVDDAVVSELRDEWNLALETGTIATAATARLSEVNHRILDSGGDLGPSGMVQLANLIRASALHHSAIIDFRR